MRVTCAETSARQEPQATASTFANPFQHQDAQTANGDEGSLTSAEDEKSYELRAEEEVTKKIRLKELPICEANKTEIFFTIWVETNESRSQEEIIIDTFKPTIEAVRKIYPIATFKCVYGGDIGKRLNPDTEELEPIPEIRCSANVPENLAELRKYFEPNFDAMLVDQTGNDAKGNPREDWNIGGTGLNHSGLEPRFLFNQTNGLLKG